MRYPVIVHRDLDSDYGVSVPDLPGCFSAGATFEEALQNAQEAILTHAEGLLMDGDPIPAPSSVESLLPTLNEPGAVWALVSADLTGLRDRVKRVNITVPEKVLSRIDAFAEKEEVSRSGLLVSAALGYISQKQLAAEAAAPSRKRLSSIPRRRPTRSA